MKTNQELPYAKGEDRKCRNGGTGNLRRSTRTESALNDCGKGENEAEEKSVEE